MKSKLPCHLPVTIPSGFFVSFVYFVVYLSIIPAIAKKRVRRAVLANGPALSCGTCVDSGCRGNPLPAAEC